MGASWWLKQVVVPFPFVNQILAIDTYALSFWPNYQSVAPELTATGTLGVQYNTIFVIVMSVSALFTAANHLWTVYRAINTNTSTHGLHSNTWLRSQFPFVHALTRLLPFASVMFLATVWVCVSPSAIFDRRPRIILWTIGLLFAKLVTHLMLAHLCAVEYHPLRRTLIPLFYFAIHTAITHKRGGLNVDENLVLYEFFILALITYLHLAFSVINEMKAVLGICCFTITSKHKQNVP
jgi:hypothetical protein